MRWLQDRRIRFGFLVAFALALIGWVVLPPFADAETVRGIDQRIADILQRLTATQRELAERAAAARIAGPFRDAKPRDFASGVLEPDMARICTP